MRRLIALLAVVGCAQAGMPPGGPPDDAAPVLLRVSPDTGRANVRPHAVEFVFDEVVNERPQAAPSLEALVLISPRSGDPDVSWRRNRLVVRPRRGWRANTPYTVTILRGLTDLRGNVDSSGWTTFFSTGGEVPRTTVTGRVFDWVAGRVAPGAFVEAMSRADTAVVYVAAADTAGRFALRHLPRGAYRLRAIVDENRNRGLDPRELFDTVSITLDTEVERELLAFRHDTVGPGIATVTPRDSVTVRLTFDKALDTAQTIDASRFRLNGADSTVIPIASAVTLAVFERLEADSARLRQTADSARRAASLDSARADSARAGVPPTRRPPPRPPPVRAVRDTAPPVAAPSVPSPATEVVLRVGTPLRPGASYRVRAEGVRNLLGIERNSDRVFTTPRTAPVDSTRAPRDSAARADSARRTRRPPR